VCLLHDVNELCLSKNKYMCICYVEVYVYVCELYVNKYIYVLIGTNG
jgi:hypothetical protein